MLLVLLRLGGDRYVLDARRVLEIIPVVKLKRIPRAPQWVAGMFDYRGRPTPVIDLCRLAEGRSARAALSSRIILVSYPVADDDVRVLGLIAESATEVIRRDETEFGATGVKIREGPYLGRVISDGDGLIQEIEIAPLLPGPVRELLYVEQEVVDTSPA